MKKLLFVFFILASVQLNAQTLFMSDETSDVSFVTRHLAGRLEGSFKGVDGSSQFNPSNLANSYIKFSFATTTVTTNDNLLGPNLIKAECFDPGKFPAIELASSSITKLPGVDEYQFNGTLKVKGISKSIVFPFIAKANAGGYDFNFAFAFSKKDYGLTCGASGKLFKIIVRTYGKRRVAEK